MTRITIDEIIHPDSVRVLKKLTEDIYNLKSLKIRAEGHITKKCINCGATKIIKKKCEYCGT